MHLFSRETRQDKIILLSGLRPIATGVNIQAVWIVFHREKQTDRETERREKVISWILTSGQADRVHLRMNNAVLNHTLKKIHINMIKENCRVTKLQVNSWLTALDIILSVCTCVHACKWACVYVHDMRESEREGANDQMIKAKQMGKQKYLIITHNVLLSPTPRQ